MANFRPDTGRHRWSLVQVRWFSRAAGREGHCRPMSLACVGSTCSVPATLGLPRSQHMCFPRLHCSGSRLLSREQALRGVHFPGLSRSGSGSRVLHKGADSVGPAFCAFPAGAAQATRSLRSTLSPGAARLLPPHPSLSFLTCTTVVRLLSLLGS